MKAGRSDLNELNVFNVIIIVEGPQVGNKKKITINQLKFVKNICQF